MVTAVHDDPYETTIVPRAAMRFPVRLPVPAGFDPDRLETWPRVEGRLEWVDGDLLYMPPCGFDQQVTVPSVVVELGNWQRQHPEFVVGSNEAGMKLGDDVRGADAAVWLRAKMGKLKWKCPRVPPILAVEVTGRDDTMEAMRKKATWYLTHGVVLVWILDVREKTAHVITSAGETVHGLGERIPERVELPGLSPLVDDLFRQLLPG
jgi:Uma2 family endonuclease